jgi:hypothetical protein
MRRWGLTSLGCCAGIFAAMMQQPAFGAPVLSFQELSSYTAVNQNQSVGWQFNVTSPITVTGLGWFDQNQNGLSNAHMVGIWGPVGNLLASILVQAGTVNGFDGQFRTAAITPITLTPGNGYIVGGENFGTSTDAIASEVVITTDPRIQYVDATFASTGSGFTRPTSFSVATTGFYGPSFSVPEPATTGLFLLTSATTGLLLRRRRRRRQAR